MIKKGILISIFGLIGFVPLLAQTDKEIVIDEDIQLIHLQDSIFVHVTWHYLNAFGRFPSNGLIIIKDGQAIMIDTPIDNDKTSRLTKYLRDEMSVDLTKLIIGHFHEDCMGGLEYLQSIGIESIANALTIEKCRETGLPIPSTSFTDSLTFDFNGAQIDCWYPGAGHSFDNITVWLPAEKILFGGCLIKSINSNGLGNLSDAVIPKWDISVKKVMEKYSDVKIVVPGHGNYGGIELLPHTIGLVENERNK
jgi:metallo-beta-lactamase class B